MLILLKSKSDDMLYINSKELEILLKRSLIAMFCTSYLYFSALSCKEDILGMREISESIKWEKLH